MSKSYTLKEFETITMNPGSGSAVYTEPKRASIRTLVDQSLLLNHVAIEKQINDNTILQTLHREDMLLFSTEHRESTLNKLTPALQNDPAIKLAGGEDQTLDSVIQASLQKITDDYTSCSDLAKEFLNTSAQMLAVSKGAGSSGSAHGIDRHFKGLSIEALPFFEKNVRSDNYFFTTSQIQMCSQDLQGQLTSTSTPSILLAHEFTHAIDDIYNKVNSIGIVFDNLESNASKDLKKQIRILNCAAKILDGDKPNLILPYSFCNNVGKYVD